MRKLVVMRGLSGSGKTSFLHRAGLASFSLSMDALRGIMAGPALQPNGTMGVDQTRNDDVYSMFRRLADERMARGELLALDATFLEARDFHWVVAASHTHRYDLMVLDFSTMPMDRVQAQNRQRPHWLQVSDEVLTTQQRKMLASPLSSSPKTIDLPLLNWQDDDGAAMLQRLNQWLHVPLEDFSSYAQIVHVGDLQGCWTVLAGPNGPLAQGFRDDTLYIFVGDLLDRGIENGRVFRWFVDQAMPRSNVRLLYGNHELHLHRWARGLEPVSEEFSERTLPQLLEVGATPEEADRVVAGALEVLPYRYHGRHVLVTHAGLSTVPAELHQISLHQFSHGTGAWRDPIDAQFERHAPPGWEQVHGHRNHGFCPIQASSVSFNLEDSVEHGGCLRVATLDPSGWRTASYRNSVYPPHRARFSSFGKRDMPFWMARHDSICMPQAEWEAMMAHPGVKAQHSATFPHIASLHFTREVFYEAAWDEVVVKARGLFVNTTTLEVVSRGYDKFFNIGERPETSLASLTNGGLKFPVSLYLKENGFLGCLGYDAETDALFLTSKKTPEGPAADLFRAIFNATVSPERQEGLRRYLRDAEASMTFEVIDPANDPHIVEYAEPHLVLLDVFHRSTRVQKLAYNDLKKVAEKFSLPVKEHAMTFQNATSLLGWLRQNDGDLQHTHRNVMVEGFVLEDASGVLVKWKSAPYAFWKSMRQSMETLRTIQHDIARQEQSPRPSPQRLAESQKSLERLRRRAASHPLSQAFMAWCLTRSTEQLDQDIIAARRDFLQDVVVDPAWFSTPWHHPAASTNPSREIGTLLETHRQDAPTLKSKALRRRSGA